jgi:large subunit ribosomal protein L18
MQRIKRHKRVRAKISGTSSRPRLSVFRSANAVYAQLIDDEKNKTIVSSSCRETKEKSKTDKAFKVGELIAEKALAKKIKEVVFDRGGYKYHGRVKQLAEGARKKGLKF